MILTTGKESEKVSVPKKMNVPENCDKAAPGNSVVEGIRFFNLKFVVLSVLAAIFAWECCQIVFGGSLNAILDAGFRDSSKFRKEPWYFERFNLESIQIVDLSNRVAIVTGSSSGIGFAIAEELYSLGCTVVITSRTLKRADRAVKQMEIQRMSVSGGEENESSHPGGKGRGTGKLVPLALDLSDLDNVRDFVREFKKKFTRLDYLSENAGMGVLMDYNGPWQSAQGYEILYAANYLGHFLLTQELIPMLRTSKKEFGTGKMVATSSIMHWFHVTGTAAHLDSLLPSKQLGYSDEHSWPWSKVQAYGNSKFLQIVMCFELQRRYPGLDFVPVTPGFISTALMDQNLQTRDTKIDGKSDSMSKMMNVFGLARSRTEGAMTTLHALLDPTTHSSENVTGTFLQPYHTVPYPITYHHDNVGLDAARGVFSFVNVVSIGLSTIWGVLNLLSEVIGQHFTWALHRWKAHPDAYNAEFARMLYNESMKAVYLTTEESDTVNM